MPSQGPLARFGRDRQAQAVGAWEAGARASSICGRNGAVKHRLASLVGTVQHTVRRHRMIAAGDRVLLAASGGPDSTGLVIVMAALAERFGCELVVAHVHHGLRGAAADLDQAAVRDLAQGLGLPFVSAAANVPDGGNLEARARDLRYAALHDMATANGCSAIATGHTRDDQAETFLLRLLRGAGATGLPASSRGGPMV